MPSMSNDVASLTICASRRINILYNAHALHFDSDNSTVPPSPQEQDPAASVSTGVGLILSPLRFDSQVSSLSFSSGTLTDECCRRLCIASHRLSVLSSHSISARRSLLQRRTQVSSTCSTSRTYLTLTTAEYPTYSYPHNADRSECMDPGCWEIKWVNRNDCLSALAASNTLSTPLPFLDLLISLV